MNDPKPCTCGDGMVNPYCPVHGWPKHKQDWAKLLDRIKEKLKGCASVKVHNDPENWLIHWVGMNKKGIELKRATLRYTDVPGAMVAAFRTYLPLGPIGTPIGNNRGSIKSERIGKRKISSQKQTGLSRKISSGRPAREPRKPV